MNLIKSLPLLLISILGVFFIFQEDTIPVQVISEPAEENMPTVEKSTTTITQVTDGDTFTTANGIIVRVLGIDTPETQHAPGGAECYGDEASVRASQLLAKATVSLETDSTQDKYDDYGRLLAYVTLPSGQDYGELMLQERYAYEYTFIKPYQKQLRYQMVEATAKENAKGLWSVCR